MNEIEDEKLLKKKEKLKLKRDEIKEKERLLKIQYYM
eukprot:CAMPEP_0170511266 /NCGR_PEP_ID=MMETSP0208-20121228/66216_1 /TAXON_ID=197538 /ORGANISM="Strombidium inclinatum, Strain S3" /LENGTH=36 /DNA_ID= /DNA_START= /DNA_END= /DNA_ORIENTATION=